MVGREAVQIDQMYLRVKADERCAGNKAEECECFTMP